MIQIDHGIPIPPAQPRGRSPGDKNGCPWRKLKISDSFVYPGADLKLTRVRASNALAARKKWDRNEYVLRVDTGVVRIWRVA